MAILSHDEEDHGLLTDIDGAETRDNVVYPLSTRKAGGRTQSLLLGLLSASLLVNLLTLMFYLLPSKQPLSKYASLARNIEEPYVRMTPYSSQNDTLQDQLWDSINIDSGVVALSDSWAAQHNLRTAQRFPWDQTKGIYILHGFHNLHCLKIIHITLSELRRGVPQSRSRHHVDHCLDALRRQILCDADDTPRATDRRPEVLSGLNQHRMCRSWEQLEDWAKKHTACYKRPEDPERDGKPKLDRFKHCPPDSGYVVNDDYVPSDEILVGIPEESQERQ
ncbi:hypothetical protein F5B19DRAFT_468783 [Rostrohypoxylon terebratum]|nr:hypothetical protein F5B19DRAFT_468783 [Rostrohypoxylon terebratum]